MRKPERIGFFRGRFQEAMVATVILGEEIRRSKPGKLRDSLKKIKFMFEERQIELYNAFYKETGKGPNDE